jgi:hypothetical protein
MKFDPSGKLVTSFCGHVRLPAGIHVDAQGNVWVVDGLPPGAGAQALRRTAVITS